MSAHQDPTRTLARYSTMWRAVLVSVGVLLAGGLIVIFSDIEKAPLNLALAGGSGLIAVGALSLLSEIFLRRSLRRELLSEVDGRAQAEKVGLREALTSTRDFMGEFTELVPTAKRIDLMFISDSSWVEDHTKGILTALKKGCRLRAVLPDHTDGGVVDHILRRFDMSDADTMSNAIKIAEESLKRLRTKYPARYDTAGRLERGVEIRRSLTIPTYSLYRVNDTSVIRVQEVQKNQVSDSPVLVTARPGAYWTFANNDFIEVFEASGPTP